MSNRPALIRQGDATRIFKAAAAAGYRSVRLITHPDGRTEFVANFGAARPIDHDPHAGEWDEPEE